MNNNEGATTMQATTIANSSGSGFGMDNGTAAAIDDRRQIPECECVAAVMTYRRWKKAHADGLRTKTQWGTLGRALLPDAKPVACFNGLHGEYDLYEEQATRPKRVARLLEAVPIDLLAAIFTVTRAAKRYRDAASGCYEVGLHAFARCNRERKEKLYALKDCGIAAATKAGRIATMATAGELTVYCGEG